MLVSGRVIKWFVVVNQLDPPLGVTTLLWARGMGHDLRIGLFLYTHSRDSLLACVVGT